MLTLSKVPLNKILQHQFWLGYKFPLLLTAVSLLGILIILLVSLAASLISKRRSRYQHSKKVSVNDDHLLSINENILFSSPPESDPDDDVLFDKNRDVIQPKFSRFSASLISKFVKPFSKESKVPFHFTYVISFKNKIFL